MHDIKLTEDWTNEAGQLFKGGVMLRVSLAVAHALVDAKKAIPMRGELPPLPAAPAPGAEANPAPSAS